MNLKEIIEKVFTEEREAKGLSKFNVQLGENEGHNIPHFHLDNGEIGNKKKKTAIRIDMPYYFLHGDKTYILNSKERKNLIVWLNAKPIYKKGNENEKRELPKTNWENLKNMWNKYYPQAKINCDKIDYSNLCKDYRQM